MSTEDPRSCDVATMTVDPTTMEACVSTEDPRYCDAATMTEEPTTVEACVSTEDTRNCDAATMTVDPTMVDAYVSTEDQRTCDVSTMTVDPTVMCVADTQAETGMDGGGGAAAKEEYQLQLGRRLKAGRPVPSMSSKFVLHFSFLQVAFSSLLASARTLIF